MRRLVVVLLVLVAAGCSGDEPQPALPAGVEVTIDQARSDLATRRVQVRVANGGDEPLTVRRATLVVPGWPAGARYEGPATVVPGGAVSLMVDAPRVPERAGVACGGTTGARVRLVLQDADGGTSGVSVAARDRYGAVARLLARDCADVLVTTHVGAPRRDGDAIVLPLGLTAGEEPVALGTVAGTVLLALAPGEDGRLDRRLLPGERWTREVRLVPARCDAHVVAEDKVGTLLPLRVEGPDGAASTLVRPSAAQQGRLLALVARLCAIGAGDDPLLDD